MTESFLRKIRLRAQVVVLSVVFAGLLFSCGEGIRLFPFPPSGAAPQSASSELQSAEARDYEKNFHRFENTYANSQAKPRRSDPQPFWIDFSGGIDRAMPSPVLARIRNGAAVRPRIFKSCLLSALLGSRAPPAP